jgi:hypothetical protein
MVGKSEVTRRNTGAVCQPFIKSNKNDYLDAEAIAEAVQRDNMCFVPFKTDDQARSPSDASGTGPAGVSANSRHQSTTHLPAGARHHRSQRGELNQILPGCVFRAVVSESAPQSEKSKCPVFPAHALLRAGQIAFPHHLDQASIALFIVTARRVRARRPAHLRAEGPGNDLLLRPLPRAAVTMSA